MQVEERIRLCRLIEKIQDNENSCIRAKVIDATTYRGKRVTVYNRTEVKSC